MAVNWGSVPEWLALAITIAIWLASRESSRRQRRTEKVEVIERGYTVPAVLPERLRRLTLAATLLFGFGSLIAAFVVVLALSAAVASTFGWLTSAFPTFGFIVGVIAAEVVAVLMVRLGWFVRKLDPRIGDAVAKQLAYMGVSPDTARQIAKLTQNEPDPVRRDDE